MGNTSHKVCACRRCGRLLKWALDCKPKPYCQEGYGCAKESGMSKDFTKLHEWYIETQVAIRDAGGSPHFIELFSPDMVEIMVRNNLHIVHKGPSDE